MPTSGEGADRTGRDGDVIRCRPARRGSGYGMKPRKLCPGAVRFTPGCVIHGRCVGVQVEVEKNFVSVWPTLVSCTRMMMWRHLVVALGLMVEYIHPDVQPSKGPAIQRSQGPGFKTSNAPSRPRLGTDRELVCHSCLRTVHPVIHKPSSDLILYCVVVHHA